MSATASNFQVSSAASGYTATSTGSGIGLSEYVSNTGTNDPGTGKVQSPPERPHRKKRIPVPEERHALAECLEEALTNAKGLEAAASNDPEQAAISGLDLRQNLRELWQLRHIRTDDWSTIVNKLQVATSKV